MQPVPMPIGLSGVKTAPKFRQEIKNMYRVGGDVPVFALRPGNRRLAALPLNGKCRGMGLYRNKDTGNEELYAVFGQKLYKITIQNVRADKVLNEPDLLFTEKGTIPGASECVLTGGFTKLLVMQVGGLAFVYDDVGGLVQITDPNYIPSSSCCYEGGRFVFVPTDGEPMFWSRIENPAVIDPQNYVDAEREPDPNKANIKVKDSVYILGSRSIQRVRYRASIDSYVPDGGESAAVGFAGGLTPFMETFAFVGQGANGGFGIYVMGNEPQPISNEYVSELINTEYSLPELGRMRSEYAVINGVDTLVFYFPRHTLVFANGGWSFWQSGVGGLQYNTWDITHIQYAYGYLFTGDKQGYFGALYDQGRDHNDGIEFGVKTYIAGPPNQRFTLRKLAASCTMGKAATVPAENMGEYAESFMRLQVSTDGMTYGAGKWRSIGDLGDYGIGCKWSGGIASSWQAVSIALSGIVDSHFSIEGIYFE